MKNNKNPKWYSEEMEKTFKCDICGKIKLDTKRRINPYQDEIFDEKIEENICERCYGNLCDDI